VEIGEAVNDMDRATQRNAALVEQSAAAAQNLREQTEELLRTVKVFRVKAEA
jgi:methyl-accepting chemotaxis protein